MSVSGYGIIYFMICSYVLQFLLPTSVLFGSMCTTAAYFGKLISNKGKLFLAFLINHSSDGNVTPKIQIIRPKYQLPFHKKIALFP